jgi:Ca2+-binding RTX toxin-like protein
MRRRALFVAGLVVVALVMASGVAWAASISCPNRAGDLCVGTNKKDTMVGRNRADEMRGKDGADTLRARRGKDTLSGGPGRDALSGGNADDTYVFGMNDWGNDTITDTASPDNDPDTGNFAEFGSPDQFLTTSLTINLTSSAGSPEVRNSSFTSTVNWSNNAIDGVYVGSITDDTINGNAGANTIVSNIGPDSDDTINAGAGNDWISVLDFAGGDSVDCGEDGFGITDDDQVFFDPGDTITNCER